MFCNENDLSNAACLCLIAVFNDVAAWEMFDKCGPNSAVSVSSLYIFP